jgi:hypothetical protein
MSDDSMPASIGAAASEAAASDEPDSALLRLHAALRDLDDSIFKALRALEATLGREITMQPERGLPYREMGRLRDQLELARGAPARGPRLHCADLAIESDDEDARDD